MHVFKINGKEVMFPTGLSYGLENLQTEGSGRSTLTGTMILKTLRKNIRNYTFRWSYITTAQAAPILQAINENDFNTITVADLLTGKDETFTYYFGGANADHETFSGDEILWVLNVSTVEK